MMECLAGTIVCSSEMEDTDTVLMAAFYDEDGKMRTLWSKDIKLDSIVEFSMSGAVDLYTEYGLFVIEENTWNPLGLALRERVK